MFFGHNDFYEEITRIIQDYPLASLIYHNAQGRLDATHLPFYYNTHKDTPTLDAHIARINPLSDLALNGQAVLLIFKAEDAYISPNWYPRKALTHKEVPTWNYQVVHVHGILHIQDDKRFVANVMARLTEQHEKQHSPDNPWKMSQTEPTYLKALIKHVVGIEIEITHIEAASKLSQNKARPEQEGVIEALSQEGKHAIVASTQKDCQLT